MAPSEASRFDSEELLLQLGQEIVEVFDRSAVAFVHRAVALRLAKPWTEQLISRVDELGLIARSEVGSALAELLVLDIDYQWTTPLSVMRNIAHYPTTVLKEAAVPAVRRDDFLVQLEPDDIYDLVPKTFADVSEDLSDLGLRWGAAKAYLHLKRRRFQEDTS